LVKNIADRYGLPKKQIYAEAQKIKDHLQKSRFN